MSAINTSVSPTAKFAAIMQKIKSDHKIPLIISSAMAITIFLSLFLWLQGTEYRPLFTHLTDQDGGEVVTQLNQMNVPYKFSEHGAAILVPSDQVHEIRLKLAQLGLPKGGNIGFELLDQEKFGLSQFSEQINYQRALEGELSRTIESLGVVNKARVHLAFPKPTLFVREQKQPTASVTLSVQDGRVLDEGQINGIVHLISGSVSGLPATNVTIVDQAGRLLSHPQGIGQDLDTSQLKYVQTIENRYQQRIESILSPLVGKGNVHAQVTAQMNFAKTEETSEQYSPNQQTENATIRSRQISSSQQQHDFLANGVPGALSNQPVATPAPESNAKNAPSAKNSAETTQKINGNQRLDETTNFEVDRHVRHTQHQVGQLQRLSVAVIVNYQENIAKGAKDINLPIPTDKLQQIELLAKDAVGFSLERGDSLNIVNAPFEQMIGEDLIDDIPLWKDPIFLSFIIDMGRYLLFGLVALGLWRGMIKPQIIKQKAARIAARTEAEHQDKLRIEQLERQKIEQEEASRRTQAKYRVTAEMQGVRLKEMAQQDPRAIAMIIRDWMGKE
ncbi:flagellar basal-body MS-ring/collar protein FliF [Moellerella wisconsensis]|uniref:flagellar basal-body MS-ring/collar protein FliF n=2 Tax=Gammaproteobacteria TaxID=1236 RepID=UPI0006416F2F|nr:flagellar basal-body MS-ring/collar protein FliF [Moellerella wisconsensis]KLN96340.1 flagellar M-ring protein FliF [Moellerella wisconsensis]